MGIERYAARDIRAAKGKITDEQIFLSNGYRDLLRTVAIGATKEFSDYIYDVKVVPKAEYAAISSVHSRTRMISVNLSNEFIKQAKTRDKKHEVILGILLHEIGHLLYTDFKELETAIKNLSSGQLLYEDIENTALNKLLSSGKKLRMILIKIYKHYSNCVEDGYIENRLLDAFPGYGECLLTLRNMQMNGDAENMKKESKGDACLSDLMNLTLEYAKYGIDYSKYKSEVAQEYFAKLKPLIDEALITDNRLKRNRLYAKGLLVFAEYLEKLSDEMQDKESDSMPSSPEDSTERIGEATRGDATDTERPESDIVPPELERLENEIAEDICKAEGHALVLKQMVKAAERGKKARGEYGFDSGRGCRCSIMEQTDDGQERYRTTHVSLDRIAGRTAKTLERVIKEREIDGYTNEQYEGAYLDMSNLYRSDKRILQDKNVPEGRPDMEAIVLVDCSGSMNEGSRMENARNCAYITWKFCQGVGIPCSVYGHTTTWDGPKPLTLSCAAHKTDKKEKGERILSLKAFSDNVDDFAIRVCAELLKESRAKKKFLFIISDGIPMADNGYHGIHADNMTRWAVEDAKRAGIGVITAGLGASCKDVKTVYVETGTQRSKHRARFLDCTDVNLLPKAFVKVLKEEIL